MRLPKFLTELSPVGETLVAMEQGVALLEQDVNCRNNQLSVATAEEALPLWEADYSLSGGAGKKPDQRRARIRAAINGGQCLTRQRLAALCVHVGGADDAEITEAFSDWRVSVTALYEDRLPEEQDELERALCRMQPAHLQMVLAAESRIRAEKEQYLALGGDAFFVLTGQDGA